MTTPNNEFLMSLHKSLSDRGLSESTVKAYIRTLLLLNDKKPFKNLSFLKKKEEILKKIEPYAEKTKHTIVATICSVLASHKDKGYKKCYADWSQLMNEKKPAPITTEEMGKKTEKEKEAWLSWKEVEEKRDQMRDDIEKFIKNKKLTEEQFELLQRYTLLALYTLVPPRRNLDYLNMKVATKESPDLSDDSNYIILTDGMPTKFIFNKYKSVKKHGQQTEDIPASLGAVIKAYLAFNPARPAKVSKKTASTYPFLVAFDGQPITTINFITRALNKIFGKKVGSSMLRHIYLSSKYDLEEMKKDAEAMGHTVQEQKNYLRADVEEKST